jgi:DUF1680 family protein
VLPPRRLIIFSIIHGAIEEFVGMTRSAREPDGYLNIHYQVVEKGKCFTNLRDIHGLYNLGLLIEGALAHNQYYGNNLFLEPTLKYVALIHKSIGPNNGQLNRYLNGLSSS